MKLLILTFISGIFSLNQTGQKFNTFYPVAQYYGSRDKGKYDFLTF